MKKLLNRKNLIISLILTVAFVFVTGAVIVSAIPDEIILFESEKLDVGKIFTVEIAADTQGILKDGVLYNEDRDGYFADVKLAGLLPVKTVHVSVVETPDVVLGGNSIGVKLHTDGLMVVGISDFESAGGTIASPARNSGVKTGDLIKAINGQAVDKAEIFSEILAGSGGGTVTLEIARNDDTVIISVAPAKDLNNNYKLGMWIRNSVVGIGTMTFFSPDKNVYGALGHGITDNDTNNIVPVGNGEVVPAKISSLKKSVKGSPGELHGYFSDSGAVGDVVTNSPTGIYGNVIESTFFSGETVSVAPREEIKTGNAQILSCIDENEVEVFDIEIERISQRKNSQTRCMVIKITDQQLLEQTGGILQGMSGSPIIQNGKLVGAVTHVFLNDPTRGYAIFAETMVKKSMTV